MRNWMLRGLVFAAGMVVVRLFQGALINAFPTSAGLISVVLLVLFLAGAVVWGVLDGRADARANPDPDRRNDLAMVWLLAGLTAGLISGVVTWLIGTVYKGLYVGPLINELSTFAAFTALVVFLGAIAGVTLGRYLIDRKGDYAPQQRDGGHGGDATRRDADTDVFAAVRSGGGTAEEGASPAYSEETTGAIRSYPEDGTEEFGTEADPEKTHPVARPEGDQPDR
jgi:hypothetical protein